MAMGMSAPGMALGFGGENLSQQLKDETDEDRKTRLAMQQQQKALGPAAQSLGLGA